MEKNQLTVYGSEFTLDSRVVAEWMDKRHDHLLRDIEGYITILNQTPEMGADKFFIESNYEAGTGKAYKCYLITRKGCDMVANKMIGEKGVIFTAKYVTKFEELEKAQNSQYLVLPKNYKEALLALVAAEEDKERLHNELLIASPKAAYFDDLVDRNLLTNFTITAKELGIQRKEFLEFLADNKYCYRDQQEKLVPYAPYTEQGLFAIKDCKAKTNGKWVGTQVFVTPKGKETFRLLLKGVSKSN